MRMEPDWLFGTRRNPFAFQLISCRDFIPRWQRNKRPMKGYKYKIMQHENIVGLIFVGIFSESFMS